jgi:phage terminase large subunit GpA-like protein
MRSNPRAGNSPAARDACGWRLGLELPPKLTVSQWADAERMIAAGTGPEPGRWRTDRTPFLRGPMDAVCDPDVHTVVLMMSSQVGKTEVAINVLAYFIAQDPAPVMLVLPDLGMAESFSKNRLGPTIEATPALLDRIGRHQSRASATTILEKSFPGGDVVLSGANSPASLASRPRRVVICDEIDKYKASIGHDGNPIKQAFQRTQNFWNAKRVLASTPTIEGLSEIQAWFERSDRRFFEVPCHECGVFQALTWEQVRWHRGSPSSARYHCEHCDAAWDQRQVHLAVRHGHWSARGPFTGVAGFHIWSIYAPWVTMEDLVAEHEDSEGKPAEEQTFVNLKLGRTYNPTKEARTTPADLLARREDYSHDRLPDDVLLITAFTDVQGDRFETTFCGWGHADEKWVVDHQVIWGDTSTPQMWARLDVEVHSRTFRHPSGHTLWPEAIGVDAGYLQQAVLNYVRERREAFRPFFAVKGVEGAGRPLWRESAERFKMGAKLHLSGTDDGKTALYSELAVGMDAETRQRWRVHFPATLDLGYFEQLVSERVKIEFRGGRPVRRWIPAGGKRNEALDCLVGCMAVRQTLAVDYVGRRQQMLGQAKTADYSKIADLFATA